MRRWRGYREALYERPVVTALGEHLAAGHTALDIGAAYGYFTLAMAQRVGPGGRVVAFEPAPRTVAALRRSVALNTLPQIEVVAAALADRSGEGRLFVPANETMARLTTGDGTAVTGLSLDDWMERPEAPRRLDLIKIDVEGAELAVLRGARRSLERHRPTILCELHRARGPSQARPRDCAAFLEGLGYRLEALAGTAPWSERLTAFEALPLGDRVLTLHLRALAS